MERRSRICALWAGRARLQSPSQAIRRPVGESGAVGRGAGSVVLVILAGAMLGGCGGDKAAVFTGSDARQLAAIQPRSAGWSWPSSTAAPVWDVSRASTTTDPLLREFNRKTAKFVDRGEASKK